MAKANTIPAEPPVAENDTIAQLQAQLAQAQAAQRAPVAQPEEPVAAPPTVTLVQPPVTQSFAAAPAVPAPPAVAVPTAAPSFSVNAQMESLQASVGGGAGLLGGIDLSGVESNNFRLLPLDVPVYEARITKAELGKSSKGDPQIKLWLKTTYPSVHAGVTIITFVTIMESTKWIYKSLLEATGTLSSDGRCFAGNSVRDFEGCIMQFTVKHDEWDGSLRNKVAGAFAMGTLTEERSQPVASGQVRWGTPVAA